MTRFRFLTKLWAFARRIFRAIAGTVYDPSVQAPPPGSTVEPPSIILEQHEDRDSVTRRLAAAQEIRWKFDQTVADRWRAADPQKAKARVDHRLTLALAKTYRLANPNADVVDAFAWAEHRVHDARASGFFDAVTPPPEPPKFTDQELKDAGIEKHDLPKPPGYTKGALCLAVALLVASTARAAEPTSASSPTPHSSTPSSTSPGPSRAHRTTATSPQASGHPQPAAHPDVPFLPLRRHLSRRWRTNYRPLRRGDPHVAPKRQTRPRSTGVNFDGRFTSLSARTLMQPQTLGRNTCASTPTSPAP